MRKINLIAMATAAMTLAMASTSFAAKILGYTSQNTTNVVWNGSTLNLNDNNSTMTPGVGQNGGASIAGQSVSFTGLGASSYTKSGNLFDETLLGGTFNIGSGLLTGTFTGADITGLVTGTTGTVALSGITYTGGAWFTGFGFSPTLGASYSTTFSLVPSSTWAGIAGTSSLGNFSGIDSTTAISDQVTSTPEPASVVTFGLGAMALMLMAGIARRRNAGSTL
jgi:hypothetical protein